MRLLLVWGGGTSWGGPDRGSIFRRFHNEILTTILVVNTSSFNSNRMLYHNLRNRKVNCLPVQALEAATAPLKSFTLAGRAASPTPPASDFSQVQEGGFPTAERERLSRSVVDPQPIFAVGRGEFRPYTSYWVGGTKPIFLCFLPCHLNKEHRLTLTHAWASCCQWNTSCHGAAGGVLGVSG